MPKMFQTESVSLSTNVCRDSSRQLGTNVSSRPPTERAKTAVVPTSRDASMNPLSNAESAPGTQKTTSSRPSKSSWITRSADSPDHAYAIAAPDGPSMLTTRSAGGSRSSIVSRSKK